MLGKPDLEQKDTQTERFNGAKSNAVVPNDSKTTSSGQSAQKESSLPGESPRAFTSIRKDSRVVQVRCADWNKAMF